jgi:LCP family protein required for cell wall assembly
MMVLHADGPNSYAVSFPRDLWVNIPGRGNMKLNAAFNDGAQKVIDTITANFGVPINHYLEVNFATFSDIVDAVGAVPVYFPYPARDELTGLGPTWAAGCYRLDGMNSLAYVRSRHLEYRKDGRWVDASPMADLDRIDRQQSFVKKLGRIAVARVMDDPLIAPGLADDVIPKLTVDDSFDRSSFNALVNAFLGLADGEGGLTFATLPWDGPATRDGQSVLVVKQPEADAVFAILKGEAPPPSATTTTAAGGGGTAAPQSAALRPVDVRVQVLNGSGVSGGGNASQAALKLVRAGRSATTAADRRKMKCVTGRATRREARLVAARWSGARWWPTPRSRGPTSCRDRQEISPWAASLAPSTTAVAGGSGPGTGTAPAAPVDPEAACDATAG